ncbi:MAG: hypothetical protein DMG30_19705 [Acidobacteria bacterium]|nr:MAG: hypothetical protein DMG30_19705 [Acidobacteriota bacterium]
MGDRRFVILLLLLLAVLYPSSDFAQNGWIWFDSSPGRQRQQSQENQKPSAPAPRHNISGMWYANAVQAGGVLTMPNDGRPEHQPPYTPYGLQLYKSHKPLEGFDAVPPGQENDPRELCDPLGVPHVNHYQNRQTQIFQDDVKVVILYQYDNHWRNIWTDGRELPKVIDGGVQIGNETREQRFYGYSVGKWVDDTTLVAETVGTMPEDRVWLDATGRPLSDQVEVTETYHRVNYDTLEFSEMIDDPKIYTKPWATLDKLRMRLLDPRTDVMEFYCSPVERMRYNNLTDGPDPNKPANEKKK